MLIAGLLAIPEPPQGPRPGRARLVLAEGWLRTEGPVISGLTLGPCPHTPDLGGPGCIVFPGFIDAHLHLPQLDSIGADGLGLLQWLDRIIFPAEARWADAAFAGQMTARAAARLLSYGTTGVAAYATVHHDAAVTAAEALHEAGLRALVGQVLMDRNAPDELTRPAPQLIEEARNLASTVGRRFHERRIRAAVSPRFAISCSEELLHAAGQLAAELGAAVQTHLAETKEECEKVSHLFPRRSYTRVYLDAGLLTPRTILAHGIYLDDQDRAVIKRSGSVIAHCPTANTFLRSGAMDRSELRKASVRLALGSDIAGGPDLSMVRVARAMIDTAKRLRRGQPPTASEAWYQITAGNASALGWEDGGRLAEGAAADIVVVRPRGLRPDWGRAKPNPLTVLMYEWDDRWLERVVAGGRVVCPNT